MTSKGNGNGEVVDVKCCPFCGSTYAVRYGAGTEYQCQYCEQTFDESEVITDPVKAWGLRLDFRAADVPAAEWERPDLTYGVARRDNSL